MVREASVFEGRRQALLSARGAQSKHSGVVATHSLSMSGRVPKPVFFDLLTLEAVDEAIGQNSGDVQRCAAGLPVHLPELLDKLPWWHLLIRA